MVVRDDEQLGRQVRDIAAPARDVAAHAFEQDDRGSARIAGDLVVDARAVGTDDERHAGARR
jgi:hypothetical protein